MTNDHIESLKEIREMVRDFARTEIAPHTREWDEKAFFPKEIF